MKLAQQIAAYSLSLSNAVISLQDPALRSGEDTSAPSSFFPLIQSPIHLWVAKLRKCSCIYLHRNYIFVSTFITHQNKAFDICWQKATGPTAAC